MSKPISFGKLDFKIVASMDKARSTPEAETPFRICVLGDFSGRANRDIVDPASALEGQRPIEVDRDNLEDVMEKLGVAVNLSVAGNRHPSIAIQFAELDDFHPDQLFKRLEVFQALRGTRKRLNDPRTFESAAEEVRNWTGSDTASELSKPVLDQPAPKPPASDQTAASLLNQIVYEAEGEPPKARIATGASEWDTFLRKIVGPHLVPGDDPEQEELVAAVDASISALMKTILHHPNFQTLEAAWRALHFLVYRVKTDALLKVYLLDISKAELAADLSASDDLRSTGIYKLLVDESVGTPGGEPWAVLTGIYTFDQTRKDAELLGRLAKTASVADAPFISAASPHLLGCESWVETPDPHDWKWIPDDDGREAWKELRKLPESTYVGLALPRFLLRLPYGTDTSPTEQFDFEEMPGRPAHDHYLWGNPSIACTYLLAHAFSSNGWNFQPGVTIDIEGLPLHLYKERGESILRPCAEVLFTEQTVEMILGKGIMPLLSFKNQDRVRLGRFQSLADTMTNLTGRWS